MSDSVELMLASFDKRLSILEKEHEFFKQTVMKHMTDESQDRRLIYGKLDGIKDEVHKMPTNISTEVTSCAARLRKEFEETHPKKHEVITLAQFRTYLLAVTMACTVLFTGVNWVLDRVDLPQEHRQ